jgi:hypothetical protein
MGIETALARLAEPDGRAAHRIVESLRPTARARNNLHPVGAQHVKLARRTIDGDRFEIGIAGYQQMAIERLGPGLAVFEWIGFPQKRQKRMIEKLALSFIEEPRHGGRRLGDHPHAAIADGVARKALFGK